MTVVAALVTALFGALVVALAADVLSLGDSPTATADQLVAYERAVVATAKQGGQTIELGLKVAIGDLRSEHRTAPSVIVEQTRAWQRDLVAARDAFRSTRPPPGLDGARRDFVAALGEYLRVADLVRDAALDTGGRRGELLDRAVAAGRRGDDLYDRGSAALQNARRRAGRPPTLDFPDPTPL